MAERFYRQLVQGRLSPLHVTVQETDLSVYADNVSVAEVRELVVEQRGYLENYIRDYPDFARTLVPWPNDPTAPRIVQGMIQAGRKAGVGPMAAVAGAVAEEIGKALLKRTDEVIIENGGDIFLKSNHPLTVAVFAGKSPLSLKVGLHIEGSEQPSAVCTSSGTVGHSLSKGLADAVCILSSSGALADAVATAVGNRVRHSKDIDPAIRWGRAIEGVDGILLIIGDKMGMWGSVQLKPLEPRSKKRLSFGWGNCKD